jgi:hypothetical protein
MVWRDELEGRIVGMDWRDGLEGRIVWMDQRDGLEKYTDKRMEGCSTVLLILFSRKA